MAVASKQRISDDRVRVEAILGDVDGKDVIIMDDEIATGARSWKSCSTCARKVALPSPIRMAFSPALDRLRAVPDIAEIVTTNTVPLHPEQRLPNMHTISIAPLLAEAIRRIHDGESVSSLFAAGV